MQRSGTPSSEVSIEQARAFCAVVESGSYSKASEKLGKSHSSIVYSIKCLEEQTGLVLFDRSKYRSTLTESGQKFYEKALRLLSASRELSDLCENFVSGWEPHLRIVYEGFLSPDIFLNAVRVFQQEKVPTTVQIYSEYLDGVEKRFRELDAHLMISLVKPMTNGTDSGFEEHALPEVQNLLVAHAEHPIFSIPHKPILEELKQYYFLSVRDADHRIGIKSEQFVGAPTLQLSDFSFKKKAILSGIGFGWLPKDLVLADLESGQLKRVDWDGPSVVELKPILYVEKAKSTGQACRRFIELLLSST